jgi:hypothetical protein
MKISRDLEKYIFSVFKIYLDTVGGDDRLVRVGVGWAAGQHDAVRSNWVSRKNNCRVVVVLL